jgi:hypothetical protein
MGLPIAWRRQFLISGDWNRTVCHFRPKYLWNKGGAGSTRASFRFVLRRSRINHRKVGKRHIAVGADTLSTGRILDPNVSGSAEEHEIDFTAFTAFYRQ